MCKGLQSADGILQQSLPARNPGHKHGTLFIDIGLPVGVEIGFGFGCPEGADSAGCSDRA